MSRDLIGSTLGNFRIIAKLGEGGMGEVYRAEDTRLGREVAVKVLPEAFVADSERLARFEREARLLATLSHPNIAAIHDVGESEGRHFLVMELVAGETLAERLRRGPVPLQEALPIALQVAAALEAAHERGIVHRDLKPANMMVDGQGQVKVLDFGLARALEPESGAESPTQLAHSPTLSYQATQAGVLMGTAAYMSPEQAKGQRADRRSDVWAFGVLLAEMLGGHRVFREETLSETLAAVLMSDPDLSALPADLPPTVRRLIERCLRKDPRQRLHDVADARLELEEVLAGRDEELAGAASAGRGGAAAGPSASPWLPWAVAGVCALLAAGLAGWLALRPSPQRPTPVHLAVTLPPGLSLDEDASDPILTISPDGLRIVFQAIDGAGRRLYLRSLDRPSLLPLPGTEGGQAPFFSPDGQWLGFSRDGLWKMPLDGGRPVAVASDGWGGGSWGEDGTILYTPHYLSGLHRVPAAGGAPEELTAPDLAAGELNHSWPDILPGGKAVLFTSFRLPISEARIEALDLGSGERQVLVENAVFGRYLDSGYLVFVRAGNLLAVPFSPRTFELGGTPVPVLEDLPISHVGGNSQLAVSREGTLVYVPASVLEPPRPLVWTDRAGNREPILEAPGPYRDPALSPDGTQIALTVDRGSLDVWVYDLERKTLSRLTFSPRSELGPVWSADGRRIFFVVDTPPFQIYQVPVDGSAAPEPLYASGLDANPSAVSPDGEWVLFAESRLETRSDLLRLRADGTGEPEVLRATPAQEMLPTLSPDQLYLAFQSDESGRDEVYVRPYPGPGPRVQVSRGGGSLPLWARSGELFFVSEGRMMAVETDTSRELWLGEPQPLFPARLRRSWFTRGYDVTPDGRRFVMAVTPDGAEPREIRVILHWSEEIQRRAR